MSTPLRPALAAMLASSAFLATADAVKPHDDPFGKRAAPVTSALEIGQPIHHAGITLYPVLDHQAPKLPEDGLLTLGEALSTGDLRVREVSGGGQVSQLQVVNTGKAPVFAQAGEVLMGGNQDRVLTEDVVIPPSGTPLLVDVNCVEQNRWDPVKDEFDYAGRAEVALRRTVQLQRSQDATWSEVARLNERKAQALADAGHVDAAFWLSPSSGTYLASLDARIVDDKASKYADEILPRLAKQDDVVGVVVAVGSEILASEVYGHPELFARVRDEAVRSYVLDAITHSASQRVYIPPTRDQAAWFLRDALASVEVEQEPSWGGHSAELDGVHTRSFVFRESDGDLLHMSTFPH